MTSVPSSYFKETEIKSITLPKSITEIADEAFYYCTNLTDIIIPDSVTQIDYQAFYNCSALKEIYLQSTVPPLLAKPYDGIYKIFAVNAPDRKIYVPAGSAEAYKAADGWSTYAG